MRFVRTFLSTHIVLWLFLSLFLILIKAQGRELDHQLPELSQIRNQRKKFREMEKQLVSVPETERNGLFQKMVDLYLKTMSLVMSLKTPVNINNTVFPLSTRTADYNFSSSTSSPSNPLVSRATEVSGLTSSLLKQTTRRDSQTSREPYSGLNTVTTTSNLVTTTRQTTTPIPSLATSESAETSQTTTAESSGNIGSTVSTVTQSMADTSPAVPQRVTESLVTVAEVGSGISVTDVSRLSVVTEGTATELSVKSATDVVPVQPLPNVVVPKVPLVSTLTTPQPGTEGVRNTVTQSTVTENTTEEETSDSIHPAFLHAKNNSMMSVSSISIMFTKIYSTNSTVTVDMDGDVKGNQTQGETESNVSGRKLDVTLQGTSTVTPAASNTQTSAVNSATIEEEEEGTTPIPKVPLTSPQSGTTQEQKDPGGSAISLRPLFSPLFIPLLLQFLLQ